MAKRNGLPLDLCWVHISLSHARANDVLDAASTVNGSAISGAITSVNRNLANTEALVKVAEAATAFTGRLPGVVLNAIIRIFTEADHDQALALVTTVEWTGPLSEP